MVKGRREGGLSPCYGAVAGVASLFELAFVGIGMTETAFRELDAGESRLAIVANCMALLAWGAPVFPGERKPRFRVVEALRIDSSFLPVEGRMALSTVCSKAALVLVFMTCNATGRETEPGAIQIL